MFLCKNLQLLQWNSQKHAIIYIYDVCLERNLPLLNKVRLIKLLNWGNKKISEEFAT